ncbi:hypothetical protein CAPTEDRAFT_94631 [Capitella teleta]|uniref:L-Fucosyltransferase n=1 Tax=Capitella teleta TaxID=283909 RepID=R7V6P1_CAPTE|nr:hypothetical protein CAPTEDRAFT_94631 [Capitella teleta]|eukprot:ELU12036.1 hypothetical protein CAPTEDRAFT_94631 [Capitella teleta]
MTSVAVHIRRGDFITRNLQRNGFAVASLGYLIRAMERFKKKDPNVFFVVASDDIKWARNHLTGIDVKFSVGLSAAEDFALLANCDHIIISSGSFGWWAAWLNGGMTIYYKGFPRKGSRLWSHTDIDQYYYPQWIGME